MSYALVLISNFLKQHFHSGPKSRLQNRLLFHLSHKVRDGNFGLDSDYLKKKQEERSK